MRHRQHLAPTVRDWALTYWAIVDGTKKLGKRPLGFLIVGTVMVAMMVWTIILLIWKVALIAIIAAIILRLWRRHRNIYRPVPWDDDYTPDHDDDIPY